MFNIKIIETLFFFSHLNIVIAVLVLPQICEAPLDKEFDDLSIRRESNQTCQYMNVCIMFRCHLQEHVIRFRGWKDGNHKGKNKDWHETKWRNIITRKEI